MFKAQKLPFENRWTSGEVARQWYLRLEREGPENVKLKHALRDIASNIDADAAIPDEFITTWLAYHTKQKERRTLGWQCAVVALIVVAAIAAITGAWYGIDAYKLAKATQAVHLPRAIGP